MKAIVFLILIPFTAVSQDLTETEESGFLALEKCTQKVEQLSRFSVDVEYAVFYDGSAFSTPNEKHIGKIVKSNSNYYQEEFGNIRILNEDYFLSIDNDFQSIYITPRIDVQTFQGFNLDTMKAMVSEVKKIKGGYQFLFKNSEILKMDFIIGSNGFLSLTRSYHRNKLNLGNGLVSVVSQIKYFNYNSNPLLSKDYFSVNQYVSFLSGGNVVPSKKYEDYQIINQIDTK